MARLLGSELIENLEVSTLLALTILKDLRTELDNLISINKDLKEER